MNSFFFYPTVEYTTDGQPVSAQRALQTFTVGDTLQTIATSKNKSNSFLTCQLFLACCNPNPSYFHLGQKEKLKQHN
jgi:hypothetical protein